MYGYVVVFGVFLVYVVVGGFLQSFGVFIDEFNDEFCKQKSCLDILALVNALSLSNYRILCCFSVCLEGKITPHGTFLLGTFLSLLSLVTSCYIQSVMMLLVTHSLLYGFGSTFMLNSPLSMIESYFSTEHRHHVLTTGIINLGPPIGVALVNPIAGYMSKDGPGSWRRTFQAAAAILALTAIVYTVIVLIPAVRRRLQGDAYATFPDTPKEQSGAGCDETTMFTIAQLWCMDARAILWLAGIFGVGFAIFIPRTIFVDYMGKMGVDMSRASVMMSYSGISEALFTLLISLSGDYLAAHILWVYVAASVILAVADALLPSITSNAGFTTYIIVQGATDGLMLTVLYGVVSIIADNKQQKRILWSATNFVVGFGQIGGLAIAGVIYEENQATIFYMACGMFVASAVCFLCVQTVLYRRTTDCCGDDVINERTKLQIKKSPTASRDKLADADETVIDSDRTNISMKED